MDRDRFFGYDVQCHVLPPLSIFETGPFVCDIRALGTVDSSNKKFWPVPNVFDCFHGISHGSMLSLLQGVFSVHEPLEAVRHWLFPLLSEAVVEFSLMDMTEPFKVRLR